MILLKLRGFIYFFKFKKVSRITLKGRNFFFFFFDRIKTCSIEGNSNENGCSASHSPNERSSSVRSNEFVVISSVMILPKTKFFAVKLSP